MRSGHKKKCLYCGAVMRADATNCPRCGSEALDSISDVDIGVKRTRNVRKNTVWNKEILLITGGVLLILALTVGAFFFGRACGRREAVTAAELKTLDTAVSGNNETVPPVPGVADSIPETAEDTAKGQDAISSSAPAIEPDTAQETVAEKTSSFEIHFLDVGQGDAILVVCDGAAMLVDGGPAGQSQLLYAYFRHHKINNLETVVCTHPHGDHIGGIPGALAYTGTKRALCSFSEYDTERFADFVKYLKGIEIEIPRPGDTFMLGSATVTVLAPISADETNLNNNSIVLKITYGETSFLLMGDAEFAEEESILLSGTDLKCDLIKIGHHGADTATSEKLLQEAAPRFAVISVGKDNRFGHPTERTLNLLDGQGITTFRTDSAGHIVCTSDGTELSFSFERP